MKIKYFKYTGLNKFNITGSLCLSFFLAYSIASFSTESSQVTSKYFPTYLYVIENINSFLETINIKFITSNIFLLTIVLFLIHILLFKNEKINFTKNKFISFVDQLTQKISLLVPIKQFTTFIYFTHLNSLNSLEDVFIKDFSNFIVLTSFILSTAIIVGVPSFFNTINRWRVNSKFAVNSGLIYHFKSIDELMMDLSFKKYIESINDIKIIKILGVTLKNTFVTNDSYMHEIINKLKNSNKPTIKLLYSKENSEGLENRAKNIGTTVEILNKEIKDTKDYIKSHKILSNSKFLTAKQYDHEPKYKMIIIEGTERIVLLQAYQDKKDILEEEVYIYKDNSTSTIYKILNEHYDELFRMFHKINNDF
ncbi:hypothetical protein [Aliarcobacter butzleri]|uniref:hypothetical protein n=1 Tax=Aliarcobacter butzleri TaxID=28197 RepID=UPI0028763B95|nr:hypothetical protein [Aliarcobacter butzleri]MDS1315761.1 hypothetical protein [Aliarcobacter butzleri]